MTPTNVGPGRVRAVTTMGERRMVNITGAMQLVGVSRRSIYNWLAAGRLEYVRTAGGAVRIFTDSLLSARPASSAPTPVQVMQERLVTDMERSRDAERVHQLQAQLRTLELRHARERDEWSTRVQDLEERLSALLDGGAVEQSPVPLLRSKDVAPFPKGPLLSPRDRNKLRMSKMIPAELGVHL